MSDVELKGIVDELLKKFRLYLSATLSREFISSITKKSYHKGLNDFEEQVKPTINLVPNQQAIDFLSNYTFDLIKDVNDDTVKKLRNELIQGLMQKESAAQIKERVRTVMQVSKNRAAAIARTETHRAYNMGQRFGATQSGLRLKKSVYNPHPESDICKHLVKKASIGINEQWDYDGKQYDTPPFHVNCRSTLLYIQEEAN